MSFKESSTEYFPDFSALLFCERLVMDESAFHNITDKDFLLLGDEYRTVFKALKDEGFLELKHYWGDMHKNGELLKQMLQKDLRHVDVWIPALRESCEIWRRFLNRAAKDDELMNQLHHYKSVWDPVRGQTLLGYEQRDLQRVQEALESPSRLRHADYRDAVRAELDRYLTMVNGSLVLASEYDCGVFDWPDHGPFYREKFLAIGARAPHGVKESEAVRKLFEVAFPQLAIGTPKALIGVLRDKRIRNLRELIHSAAMGDTEFDLEFANRTLQEVVKAEQRVGKLRKYISYTTLPIGFLPMIGTPAQKAVEELASVPFERRAKRNLGWYYMLSESLE